MAVSAPATANPNGLIGEVNITAATYCPRNTFFAGGGLLDIAQETMLYSLYANMYGGDGRVTFALPDLRGRTPMHTPASPGWQGIPYWQGDYWGYELVHLTSLNLPAHSHNLRYSNTLSTPSPNNSILGTFPPGVNAYTTNSSALPGAEMAEIGMTGANESFNIVAPSVALTFCVNTDGSYPPRN